MKLKDLMFKAFMVREPIRADLQLQEYEEHAPVCTDHSFVVFIDGPDMTGNCRFCDAPIEHWPSMNPFVVIH